MTPTGSHWPVANLSAPPARCLDTAIDPENRKNPAPHLSPG